MICQSSKGRIKPERGGYTITEQLGFVSLYYTTGFSFSNKIGTDYSHFTTKTEPLGGYSPNQSMTDSESNNMSLWFKSMPFTSNPPYQLVDVEVDWISILEVRK